MKKPWEREEPPDQEPPDREPDPGIDDIPDEEVDMAAGNPHAALLEDDEPPQAPRADHRIVGGAAYDPLRGDLPDMQGSAKPQTVLLRYKDVGPDADGRFPVEGVNPPNPDDIIIP